MNSLFAQKIKNIVSSLEDSPFVNSIILISAWIFLRIFFEGILEEFQAIGYSRFSYQTLLMYFVHFPLFYLTTYLFTTIFISILIGNDIIKVTKITGSFLGLIIFVPVIDAIIGGGYFITYPSRLEKFYLHFLNPFKSLIDIGVSIGQRIVILCICFLTFVYAYIKTKKIIKSILLFFVVLLLILLMGSITTLLAGNQPERVFVPGGLFPTDTQKFSAVYGLLIIVALLTYLYLASRKNFNLFISSVRIARMVFYGFLGISGFILSQHQLGIVHRLEFFNLLAILFIFLSPAIGFCALQILNDFFDERADAITRQRNPLVRGVSRKYYISVGILSAFISLLFSVILNYQGFLIILSFLLIGVIYSVPPVRLKRFPLISTFTIAIAVILSIGFGFSTIYYEKALHQIPHSLIYAILCGVTLGFTAKDINDVNADRNNGVISLPVLLYKNETMLGRLPIGLIIGSGYIFFGIFIPEILQGSILASSLTFFYILFKKEPKEWFYFLILFLFFGYILISLII